MIPTNTLRRSFLLAALLGAGASIGACMVFVPPTEDSADAVADAGPVVSAPLGCEQTMCDFLYGVCESSGCPSSAEADPCPANRDACRATASNAICIDDLANPAPDGGPPCNADLSAAACACGADYACGQALLDSNPACAQCNAGSWATTCLQLACPGPVNDLTTCASAAGCAELATCAACSAENQSLTACENAAVADPSDPGGCYSGSHACWVDPACP